MICESKIENTQYDSNPQNFNETKSYANQTKQNPFFIMTKDHKLMITLTVHQIL